MDNADALRAKGVAVPRRAFDEDFMLGGHVNIARELSGDVLYNPRFGTLEDVLWHLRASQTHAALLTSELFEFLAEKPDAIARLGTALADEGYQVKVLVYLRARDRYIESLYSQLLRHGFDCPFDEYLSYILQHGRYDSTDGFLSFQFEYAHILEPFAKHFGKENLIVKRYGDHFGKAFLADFLETIGIKESERTDLVFHKSENETLSFIDALALLFENAKCYAGADGPHPEDLLQPYGSDCAFAYEPFSVIDPLDGTHLAMRFSADRVKVRDLFDADIPLLQSTTDVLGRKQRRSILRDAAVRWGLVDYRNRCITRHRAGMLPLNIIEAATEYRS